ncbi:5'-3' exonuclease (including N-terminal domain of PolI) [Desulfosporosinus acidiphilus SJ4]|uniref:5'-3' exonuclease n=1 Tax=Desulfosporosinus acidiphilus (strain DSM 22704 / JCM 16185 / SJ4) TaxID=646529 RepID=I4DB19_DESAJ|nr:5'-3' exonuclease [Desulfosporosinus acidiphilus]AFM42993.1 5'-3' exonuclease (including N-terminal domain of PolI) [Desulfosporosinus acidiphilus SJ4]
MLLLFDANNVVARYFYGRPPVFDARGHNIHAVSGIVNLVLRYYAAYRPSRLIVCWDSEGVTFRHKLYPDYKATRKPAPAELIEQIPRAKKALENLNIPQIAVNGYEADDIIGTLASKSEDVVRIVSGDRDLFQLISRNITVDYLRARKGPQPLTLLRHEEIYGIDPGQWVDFKALVGDPTDNIPGVLGIGEKTVWPLLKQGLTLKNLLEYPDILPVKAARKLLDCKEKALLSWELTKINCYVPLEMPLNFVVDVQSPLSQTTLRILGVKNKIA